MLFSCSVEYRATLSGTLFGQFQKKISAKFAESPGPMLSGVLMYSTREFLVVHKKHNTSRNTTTPPAILCPLGRGLC